MTDFEAYALLDKAIDYNFRLTALVSTHRCMGSTTELVKSALVNNGIIIVHKQYMQKELNDIARRLTGQTVKVKCLSLYQLPNYLEQFNGAVELPREPMYFDDAAIIAIAMENNAVLRKLKSVKFDSNATTLHSMCRQQRAAMHQQSVELDDALARVRQLETENESLKSLLTDNCSLLSHIKLWFRALKRKCSNTDKTEQA